MDRDKASQQPVGDFLADPATHGGAPVTRIDTHAASVFLAGNRALKIKRAVKFPFLDFTTLEKRKAACEAEIAINRPFAPDIYHGVRAILRQPDGTLRLDGQSGEAGEGHGEPVEYAVEMTRFDETRTLDRFTAQGGIDDALADALGRAVARAHAVAPVATDANFTAALGEIIRQNIDELRAASDLFAAEDVASLSASTNAAYETLRALLDARERDGFVRRCHGDLHLGNIVLIDGAPMLFDALEFNAKLATIDTFYDLAFLLMDLIERGFPRPANIVLNRYLAATGFGPDIEALAALPLFLSVRAAIRAKVTAALPNRDAAAGQSARDYFRRAHAFLRPSGPILIAVGGLSGTGKSVLARALAADIGAAPGAVVLRSDVMRKHLFGVPETERLPASAYAPEVTAKVYAALADQSRRALLAGHSAVVDAVFAKSTERTAIAQAAGGAGFRGLFLTADLDTRVARVGRRRGDASDADEVVARMQLYDLGHLDWAEIDASGTPEETLMRSRKLLGACA